MRRTTPDGVDTWKGLNSEDADQDVPVDWRRRRAVIVGNDLFDETDGGVDYSSAGDRSARGIAFLGLA